MRKPNKLSVLSIVCAMLATACLDFGTNPDDGNTEVPSDWGAYPVEAGTTAHLYGISSEVGDDRWAFELDWGSPDNDVTFVVYEQTASCSVPALGLADPDQPTCPVVVGDTSRGKPKRLEWVGARGVTYALTARNKGPGDDIVMIREIRFE